MLSVLVGACIGTILGNSLFDKFMREEKKIDVEFNIENSSKEEDIHEFADKIKEAIQKNHK